MLFPKALVSWCINKINEKKIEIIFAALYFYIYELKKSHYFKILFQTGDINIFVFHGVFLVDMFN